MFFNFLTKFTVGAQIMTCPKSIYRCHNLTEDFQQRFSRISHTYSEPCQTSKIELSTNKDNSFQYLTISLKKSILDVWQIPECDSEYLHMTNCNDPIDLDLSLFID